MAIRTTQDAFHPMRGHVDEGTKIEMRNGDVWQIKADSRGWGLVRQDGSVVARNAKAHEIAYAVYRG